jgi:bifunctional DNA-binding transcriptional regulator/antitoxin component of YhaV-PrlF toxin-antitoxin module
MQYTATLSSQYKIVVPKAVRQVLDVGVGENLVFDLTVDKLVSVKKVPSFLSLAGSLLDYIPKSKRGISYTKAKEGALESVLKELASE